MPKYTVLQKRISWFSSGVVIEAKDEDELMDIVADGLDWEFIESDDEYEIEEVSE